MDTNTRKEEFSYAYIHAIASTADFCIQQKTRPMDASGLDISIKAAGMMAEGIISFPKIDA